MKFIWPDSARAELRAIDRDAAMRILQAITLYARTGEGDLKALSGRWEGCFRLRVGEISGYFLRAARPNRNPAHPASVRRLPVSCCKSINGDPARKRR